MAAATTLATAAAHILPKIKTAAAQNLNGEHHPFSPSDDVVIKQILAMHSHDGSKVDETPLLNLIEDILQRATPMAPQTHTEPVVEDKAHPPAAVGILKELANTIHRISCEMTCKCTSGSDAEATLALFRILSSYSWGVKVVLVLAAFAMNYGEFWLIAQLHTVNPLAKSVSLLKQLPDIIEHSEIHKPQFDTINNLIKVMLDITKCIVEFEKVTSEYLSDSQYKVASRDIPISAYWTINSVRACATQITMLIGRGHGYISSTFDLPELSRFDGIVVNIHRHLAEQLKLCRQHTTYQTLVRLFQTDHIDNTKILRTLLYSKDDLPLLDGEKRVRVDLLRSKIVMFFISDLDVSHEELSVLVQIYEKTRQERPEKNFEIIWLPVLDKHQPWSSSTEETYNSLKSIMSSWYLLHDPLQVDAAVIKYIRDVWRFKKNPILVVLDPQGKLVCPNALHMMWIWGTLAFPFTANREEQLWKEETWRLEFLVREIDPEILTWVKEGRHVCLYGGDDIDWIGRFTTALRDVKEKAKIPLEMIYVGKSKSRERLKKTVEKIKEEKLGDHCWEDPKMVWFWLRLESMWYSKIQRGKTIENDPIMKEVMTLLSFNSSDEGWALISLGSVDMVKDQGNILIDCLKDFDKWKETVGKEGFTPAMKKALSLYVYLRQHCTHLLLPGNTGKIMEKVVCTECKLPMEKFILYRCCHEQDSH